MSVQINVQASQTALAQSIAQGVAAFNARYAGQNQLNLQINSRNFSQPLGRITSDLADFESALKASNARVLAFGASTAVLGGVTKAFKEIANVTIEVEKSLTDINRVLNLSTSGLQKFSSELFNVSKQTASSFNDASKAALEFSRQGLDTEETLKRTADALTLVRLTGISSTKAVEDLTATINGFSKAGLTTTQVVNKLAAVEQDFAVSAADLTEALSRTGQAAQEAGVDFDELNALVTTAQQNTARGGAVIGNALKTIFTRLQRTETLDQLEKFNIIVRDVQGNILPAVQILQNFANKYNDLADAQRAQLSEQVAGVYQVNILKGIITDLTGVQSTYSKALERGAQASNEADIANQKLNKTLSALAAQTGVGLQQLANNIGKVTFAPLFEAIVSPINDAVKYINDTLEGEGPGSIFANGLLKGIRNVIAGPGLAVTFAVIAKVAKNTFEDATKALPAILGLTTEAQKRANIEKSIIAILQTQSNLSLALQGQQGNAATQAATILNYAKLQTAQYQQQLQIAQQLAPLLAAQNVTVGSRGIQVGPRIKAGGHIPAFAEMSERMGAAMGGYKSGKVVKAPRSVGANTYMNSAEEVKYVSGFAQPFINPPANSKAGRKHRQNAINRTGIDPYMASGFIPNFAEKSIKSLGKESLNNLYDVGDRVDNQTYYDKYDDQGLIKMFKLPYTYDEYRLKAAYAFNNALKIYKTQGANGGLENANKYLKNVTGGYAQALEKKYFEEPDTTDAKKHLNKIAGGFAENDTAKIFSKHSKLINQIGPDFSKIIANRVSFVETKVRKNDVSDEVILEKFLRGYAKTSPNSFKRNKEKDVISAKLGTVIHAVAQKSQGFIPNFAPPTSAMRIPWFKKFANPAYDNIQPTLGISKASDVDTFRQTQFRSTAKNADKQGDPNIFGPLYEAFGRRALQLVNQSNIFGELVTGSALQSGAIRDQTAFDAGFLQKAGIIGVDYKGFPKINLSGGSVAKHMTDKYNRVLKTNPEQAAKIKEAIMIFNEPGHENQLPSEFGKNFIQLAGTSYSQMLKNTPNFVKELSAETNMLLERYVKDPNFLRMNAAGGFIPNFANPKIKINSGKDAVESFYSKGSEVKGKKLTGGVKAFLVPETTDLYSVGSSSVSIPGSGFGISLYDAVLAEVSKKGAWLTSDRFTVSDKARRIWDGYRKLRKGDVKNKKLPMKHWFLDPAFNNGSYEFPMNPQDLSKNKSTWPPENDPVWSLQYAYQFKKSQLENKMSSGFIPNFNFIKGRNSFQKNWLIETAKKRNLNLNDPNTFAKLATEFAKTYPNDQGMFGLNKGFIPNFAYKQSVMSLEENMSGKNAILDTTTGPFPFIRNSDQPNFASAISDHGGLKNALNDSMRNQEAAGLMSSGYIPNFATVNAKQTFGIPFTGLGTNEQKLFVDMNKALSELTRNTKLTSQQQQILVNTVQTNALVLQQSTKSASIVNDANNALVKALQQNAVAQQKAAAQATAQAAANTPRAMPTASSSRVAINPNNITQPTQPSRFQSLNNKLTNVVNNPAFQIAVPMIAGQLESIVARGRDRSQMGYAERLASTGASATLTGASTGAFIGSMVLPGIGTAAGAAIGAIVGFSGAMTSAKDKVEDFNKVVGDFIQRDKEQEDAVQGYLNSLKKLEQGGLSPKEQLKTEKERQKFLLKIPSALRNQISPTGTSVEVQNLFEQFEQRNEKRQKVMSLSILGASDRTEYDVERAMQTIAELATIDDSFKKIGAILIKASNRDERATLFEKGGIIQTLLKQSDIVKSLDPKQQIKLFEDFKTTFDPSFYDKILGESSAGQDYKAIRFLNERFGNMISAKQDIKKGAGTLNVQRSATSIYTAIENFLSETNIELKRNLAAEEFKDKFDELKSTFNNVLIEGLLTPAQFVESELKDKKSFLQNSFDRETRKANFEFSKTFAEQIRNTPVFGASPDIMARLETLTANKNAGVQEYQSFFESIVNQNVTEDTINKFKELLRAQKFAEEERSANLQRETKILEENARQQRIRKELAIFEANAAASSARYASQRETILREQESQFKIDQAKSQSYLNYQPNFYNMPMQQQSELQIRYREQESKKSLELQTRSDIENARKVAEAAINRINNEIRKLEASGSPLSAGIAARMKNSYFANKKDADKLTLESLPELIKYQKEYLAGLDKLDPMYQDEVNTLKDLETIHRDINIKVKEETELLKIRNEEDRRRLRDAKSFSVGLSAGFNTINQERETFRKDFGEKIPGLFRDGLVGAMDAALNKADDLESALMGVAASFLREIQGMMLRNIANNIVGSVGSAFSFGQPAAGVEPNFKQRGGIIRAQKGMYISGGRTGDKNPALLEDGEYVLNRNAVRALGGPKAIDNMNFNAFPRFATGGDPGTMSASADAGAAFERLSMFGREQSPEFQNYMDKIREEEAAKEKKRAERKALLNQFLGTLITTGISMGISSAVSAARESSAASANLKGATGTMADGKTTTQVTSFSDAKKLINSGGSVTLGDGSVINKSSFGSSPITKSTFNDISASRFAASGISVKPGSMFGGKPNYNVQGTTTPYNSLFPEYGTQVNANFSNLGSASNFTRNMSNFKPRVPNVRIRGGRQEGGIIGLNQGGFLPYGSRLTDSIPAYLSGGEYVVNSKAVRKYGVGGLNRINAGIARFQDGGPVQSDMMSPSNTSNSSNSNIAINITVNATNGKSDGEESDNTGSGTEGNAKELSNRIKSVVLDVITNEQRTGGLLDSTKKR